MKNIRPQHSRNYRRGGAQKLFSRELRAPLIFLALAVSLPLVIRFAVHEFIHKRQSPLSHAEWKLYSPGRSRLSLLLPDEPVAADGKGPIADPALQINRYQVTVDEFRVCLWEVSYRDEMPADLRQAVPRVSAALLESGEIAEYKENIATTKRYGRDGLLVSGTFRRRGGQRHFRALLMGEGHRLWQVVVSHPVSSHLAAKASQRIIDSVRLN